MKNKNYLTEKITWTLTDNAEYPYQAVHDGKKMLVRLNDFPAEHLYTLFVDGEESDGFDDWESNWSRAPKAAAVGSVTRSAGKSARRGIAARTFGKSSRYSARKA